MKYNYIYKNVFKRLMLICYVLFLSIIFNVNANKAEAADYFYRFDIQTYMNFREQVVYGYNLTQGIYKVLPSRFSSSNVYPYYAYGIVYTVPDDGSTWNVVGFGSYLPSGSTDSYYFYFTNNHTTSGSFTGYSPKTATDSANTASANAQNAANMATQARDAANTASINAQNAYNDTNYIRNSMLSVSGGIVQDATGTVLAAARSANLNANNAASRTWDTVTSKSVATLARETMNNTPVIISKVQGVNQATCTSGTSFTAVVSISPSNNISYSVSCVGPVTPTISVSGNNITLNNLTAAGAYTATITATNTVTGGTAQTTFVFFKV